MTNRIGTTITDREYEIARNKLIPTAETYADKVAGPKPKGSDEDNYKWSGIWNRAFYGKMNEMARSVGLVG